MSTESWAVAAPQTIEVGAVTAASVRLQAGRVEVVADAEGTSAVLEVVEVGDKPLQVVLEAGRLRVGYERTAVEAFVARVRSLGDSEHAVVRLRLPAGVTVDVGTTEADIDVTGTPGTVVKTVTGAVRTVGTSGSLYLKTVSGDAGIDAHAGDVSAQTVSGNLSVTGNLGRVTVASVSAAIAVAASGTTPMVSAKTVSGDVTVRLDPGTPVSLRVRGAAGQAVLDGHVLDSQGRTLSVDHADPPSDGRSVAYVTATVTSARVVVSRT
ncbi:hypothetical protein ATJ88_2726 [Isoptericola jiangsuensis]|uniref:Adhesin n=1 Tax=Isoptericola jiangsuensis TaxID=548579 RepID=A0A2A9F0Q6_9MICO|nr:hypothetical protein [Isoptericola jiangsuensis]PFG44009.1 hypothetical protein ATJ88_2726 [Isoptericola jiangsuensis]